jgi:lipoyl-dependent peroxiredoxin
MHRMATRNGSAEWRGDLPGGGGDLTVGDGVFEGSYSAASRFEEGEGTNPEELVAAAHAACFSMALSNILASDGHTPDSVRTQARVHLRNVDGAPTLARIELEVEGRVSGIDEDEFRRYAEKAKSDCLISRALGGVGEMEVSSRLA